MSKGQPAESGKESRPDDVPLRPFQLPYLYQRVFFFFSHQPPRGALELELRRRRHTGGLQRSVDTITSHIPDPPAVPIGDTREENTADKEIGLARPQTIPSP